MRSAWFASSGMLTSTAVLAWLTAGVWAHADDAKAPAPADSAGAATAPVGSAAASASGAYLEPLPPPSERGDAGTLAALGQLPDPRPLVANERWVFDLTYREGNISLRDVRKEALSPAAAVPRRMGRFVLELYVGAELLERVRFDFPLLGAGEYTPKRRWDAPPNFERFATSSATVAMANSSRATRLILLDRASGQAWKMPWPPPPPRQASAAPHAEGAVVPASAEANQQKR